CPCESRVHVVASIGERSHLQNKPLIIKSQPSAELFALAGVIGTSQFSAQKMLQDFAESCITDNNIISGAHQKPSPFFPPSTPSTHRFSSLPPGYSAESACANRQRRVSWPTPSSTRKRLSASPRPAAKRSMAWCRRSSTVACASGTFSSPKPSVGIA